MGKASRWFRSVLGLKKSDKFHHNTSSPAPKEKCRWSFVKSYREKHHNHNHHHHHHHTNENNAVTPHSSENDAVDPNKHAIAVAAATAAVAEAAVAAAQAAAAVVRLTTSGRCATNPAAYVSGGGSIGIREEWAAVKIQAAFRGCLVRMIIPRIKFPSFFYFLFLYHLLALVFLLLLLI